MTLQQLADIGTFIGAVVVAISVLYVAVQVRQNSELLERTIQTVRNQAHQNLVENFNSYRQLLMDRDVAELYVRGLADYGSLAPEERVRFNMVASSYVWTACFSYYQLNTAEGLVAGDLNDRVYADMFRHPGFRDWFGTFRPTVGGEYGDFLVNVMENIADRDFESGENSNLLQGRFE